ncbi:hypothetical protein AWB76_07225 [Caballeronia temeraria]|uniref:Uncharacterized protein n=1 Tax=Caballeronia temeraria TaxID=1777137 RepID=A0A158DMW1_9BURK|nr:hypothetical protein [Caballeronia temeraria]SAK95948.1 hypothetical protein AWB76_07225 [Caballeronia temeraria]
MSKLQRYLVNLLVLLDEAGNTLTGGSPNETISSRAGKAAEKGKPWGCVLCRLLNCIQKDHCKIAMAVTIGEDAVLPD